MRVTRLIALIVLITSDLCVAQEVVPFTPDSLTRGLWHFDESAGDSVRDTSPARIHGFAVGTGIVAGRFGNARSFNGVNEYVVFPSSPFFDFDTSSFRIDLWFKAYEQATGQGQLIRRGLHTGPGFMIVLDHGTVVGQIGYRAFIRWPDTLVSVRSDTTYADGFWHQVSLVRDRTARKLYLYVDGVLATQPAEDQFTMPLTNYRPLTIGRWEDSAYPYFFNGVVDEVRIWSPAPGPSNVRIQVQPEVVDFGNTRIGSTAARILTVFNRGVRDRLRVSTAESSLLQFKISGAPLVIDPGGSAQLNVSYSPVSVTRDSGVISIVSDDPANPILLLKAVGNGLGPVPEPIIDTLGLVTGTGSQIRIRWFRSMFDSSGAADPVIDYSIWRSLSGTALASERDTYGQYLPILQGCAQSSWEFLATVPAMGFEEYSCVVPGLLDYTRPGSPNVFTVAARTRNLQVYFSPKDTVYLLPGQTTAIWPEEGGTNVREFTLLQNYPNPFNPSTVIRYGLPAESPVELSVFNSVGQRVATLVHGVQAAGYHEVTFDAAGLASGVYVYRMQAGGIVQSRRLLLVR